MALLSHVRLYHSGNFWTCTHHTNIHSCRSFPWLSCFGHTSRNRYINFFRGFDLEGMTNRIMCMRRPVWGSPFSIMERIFFCRVVSAAVLEQRGAFVWA